MTKSLIFLDVTPIIRQIFNIGKGVIDDFIFIF